MSLPQQIQTKCISSGFGSCSPNKECTEVEKTLIMIIKIIAKSKLSSHCQVKSASSQSGSPSKAKQRKEKQREAKQSKAKGEYKVKQSSCKEKQSEQSKVKGECKVK